MTDESGADKRPPLEDRARGLMVGLLLGDGYDQLAGEGRIRSTCVAQLALFTLEGMVRACVRADHKGICSPEGVVWHAWSRWAHGQGLGPSFARQWSPGTHSGWPDGWLHQVGPLTERRGRAPATVAALRQDPRFPEQPRTASDGYHAVTRSLPVALLASVLADAARLGGSIAALTHGAESAQQSAAAAVGAAAALVHGAAADLEELASGVPAGAAGSAAHAVAHGARAAYHAWDINQALLYAAPHGRGASTVAGALFGAARGIEALASEHVNRLEVAWVADQLARDAVAEVLSHPAGTEFAPGPDPTWWGRYPGW